MATHHTDVSVGFQTPGTTEGRLDLSRDSVRDHSSPASASGFMTVDIAVTEWVADSSIPGSSALGTRTNRSTRGVAETLVAAVGYVDCHAIDSIHETTATPRQVQP